MEAMILKFVDAVRAAGLRVSTVEVMDCLSNLSLVDVLDEAQFVFGGVAHPEAEL